MKYEITASSCWDSEEFGAKYESEFKRLGYNIEKRTDESRHDKHYWVIEINELSELVVIVNSISKVILSDFPRHYDDNDLFGAIELYDGYRE